MLFVLYEAQAASCVFLKTREAGSYKVIYHVICAESVIMDPLKRLQESCARIGN